MTLQTRNTGFLIGIIISALALAFVLGAALLSFPVYPQLAEESFMRSTGLAQWFLIERTDISSYVPLITTIAAVLFSLISIWMIRSSFEKTQSEEIIYIGLFVLSLAAESIRIIIPLKTALALPGISLLISSRILIFARCFGLFSLFAASLCASGLNVQKERHIVLSAVLISMVLALGIPIDIHSWDSSLDLHSGYASMFRIVEIGIPLLSIISFFLASYIRSSNNYIFIGLGSLMIFAGRDILIKSDTWITPGPGLFILAAGTWLVCTRLHRIYLWM